MDHQEPCSDVAGVDPDGFRTLFQGGFEVTAIGEAPCQFEHVLRRRILARIGGAVHRQRVGVPDLRLGVEREIIQQVGELPDEANLHGIGRHQLQRHADLRGAIVRRRGDFVGQTIHGSVVGSELQRLRDLFLCLRLIRPGVGNLRQTPARIRLDPAGVRGSRQLLFDELPTGLDGLEGADVEPDPLKASGDVGRSRATYCPSAATALSGCCRSSNRSACQRYGPGKLGSSRLAAWRSVNVIRTSERVGWPLRPCP